MDEGEMLILFVGILIVPPFLKLMKPSGQIQQKCPEEVFRA